ncbi:hypothetical protein QI238_11320 [Staphylococcus saprophyticus]|nr:hypothetical protein [Staphylococcus saprophyticus]
MSEYLNGLIEHLELTEAQKLSKMNYDKAHKEKQEQEKAENPNDNLDSTERQLKKENIMSIKDDTARQAEIAKNITLFK